MGGPSMTERSVPLIMSLINIHIVCCKQNLEANLIHISNKETLSHKVVLELGNTTYFVESMPRLDHES